MGAFTVLLLSVPATAGNPTTASSNAARDPISTVHQVARLWPKTASGADLAVSERGVVFVAKTISRRTGNIGQVVRISPAEKVTSFGPRLKLGQGGRLTGLTVSEKGQLYVAASTSPGRIYRIRRDSARVVARSQGVSRLEGLAVHRGRLFVTDPWRGAVWRFTPREEVTRLETEWLRAPLLRPDPPGSGKGLGVNGLAFWKRTLFLTNTDKGTILKVRVRRDGTPGVLQVVSRRPVLRGADGMAFDARGMLWVTGHGFYSEAEWDPRQPWDQRLMLFTRAGDLLHVTEDAAWMNYPNALAPGRTPSTADRMYVLNGSYFGWPLTVVSFRLR